MKYLLMYCVKPHTLDGLAIEQGYVGLSTVSFFGKKRKLVAITSCYRMGNSVQVYRMVNGSWVSTFEDDKTFPVLDALALHDTYQIRKDFYSLHPEVPKKSFSLSAQYFFIQDTLYIHTSYPEVYVTYKQDSYAPYYKGLVSLDAEAVTNLKKSVSPDLMAGCLEGEKE